MAITAKLVNELRQKTGAGMMDCKRALEAVDGDLEAGIKHLREKGMAAAGKKSARVAAEGKVEILVSDDSRLGALVDVNCETDFVARGDDFQGFCRSVAEQVLDGAEADAFEEQRKQMVTKVGENLVVRRSERFALADGAHGRVVAYQHMGGRIGVMVQLTADKAEVAQHEEFTALCTEIAMHVAAAAPQYLTSDQVPADVVASETEIYKKQAIDAGKPAAVAEKMVVGRLRKYFGEFCLVDQPWVREPKQTIGALLKETGTKVGGTITIERYARFQLGEGIEKKTTDLAAEVKAQVEAAQQG